MLKKRGRRTSAYKLLVAFWRESGLAFQMQLGGTNYSLALCRSSE